MENPLSEFFDYISDRCDDDGMVRDEEFAEQLWYGGVAGNFEGVKELRFVSSPAQDELLDRADQKCDELFGVSLPDEYRRLYALSNGLTWSAQTPRGLRTHSIYDPLQKIWWDHGPNNDNRSGITRANVFYDEWDWVIPHLVPLWVRRGWENIPALVMDQTRDFSVICHRSDDVARHDWDLTHPVLSKTLGGLFHQLIEANWDEISWTVGWSSDTLKAPIDEVARSQEGLAAKKAEAERARLGALHQDKISWAFCDPKSGAAVAPSDVDLDAYLRVYLGWPQTGLLRFLKRQDEIPPRIKKQVDEWLFGFQLDLIKTERRARERRVLGQRLLKMFRETKDQVIQVKILQMLDQLDYREGGIEVGKLALRVSRTPVEDFAREVALRLGDEDLESFAAAFDADLYPDD